MAKRFIDTELLANPNVRVMPTLYKLFWVGLITRTDHAGIWVKDFEMMSLLCGGKIEEKKAMEYLSEHIVEVDKGRRWFIPRFLDFQYPRGLNKNVRAHESAIEILKKYDLWDEEKERVRVTLSEGFQDMDMDKDMVKDKVIEKKEKKKKEKKPEPKPTMPFNTEKFRVQWDHWKIYRKKEFNKSYKSIQSEQAALTKLLNLSEGNEGRAIEIIHQSMANNWQGHFPLKIENNGKANSNTEPTINRQTAATILQNSQGWEID